YITRKLITFCFNRNESDTSMPFGPPPCLEEGRGEGPSDRNPLDLIERDLIAGTVIELGCARAFARGHGLRIFQRATGIEIRSNARRAENVAAELALQAGLCRAPANHLIGVHSMHRPVRQHPGPAGRRAEEGGLPVLADPGRGEILVEELLEL